MTLNHDRVGIASPPVEHSWTESDCLLYAVAVGAGQEDPLGELSFTTENSTDTRLQALPTFANVVSASGWVDEVGDFDPASYVHAEQDFELHAPFPVRGRIRSTSTLTAMYDKGSAAVVVNETVSVDAVTDKPLFTTRGSIYIRNEGNWGGERGPSARWQAPAREPDHVMAYRTRPEQALVYRLTGDRNPLHSDPVFAGRGGFDRPILHGMCTYGYAGRALVHAVCQGDASRFRSMQARFTNVVYPGDPLEVQIWVEEGNSAAFRVRSGENTVLDAGRASFTSP